MTDKALRSVLAEFPFVELAILYGSVARDEAGPTSDLDLAVMGAESLSAEDILTITRHLGIAFGRPVDLVDLRHTQGALLREIFRTGRRVLESDSSLYPQLLSRHLLDEADFRPIHDRILAERRHAWIGA